MGCNTETKQIGEREYSVTQWPAETSLLMKMRLLKTFGASFALIASAIDVTPTNTEQPTGIDQEAKALADGLSNLFKENSPEELVALFKDCVVGVGHNGEFITSNKFNEIFSGDNLLDIYKVTLFVIQVNYGNLFKGQLADRFLAKLKQKL